ncbi:GNAT family N-acyltransferase [Thauera linaloolentis]|uniref:PEP-CTERM/exosortase system-associated acyltransferase n=1 Tax=Thauera linaloolentis (strain DSM 12138 / JCM 21573 / CCUG 41526 / CIP 105981 / IAM 15112 / NBRC 102519 / 47Lol) TaxID=1123367 RepID=N6YE42_THAL4|nr:GNAT family N-acyltransferase [Thauera linaloolentis]ENO89795.1 hypothetical protein C666_04460 [Thauera linaloolentis 47Lol = DSM 12138]MCM8567016.1 GNAT family N-acetyltransferase [Thauera linaloolentis]
MLLTEYEYLVVAPGTAAYCDYLALRHEVFCEELKRVPSSGMCAKGMAIESDRYDIHSVHVLCRSREAGDAVGCSRLILPGPNGLNVSARYRMSQFGGVSRQQLGEIGRLTLSPRLRRSRGQMLESRRGGQRFRRDGSMVALGLYRELFHLAGQYGITHCLAAMEPSLARLLNRLGFPFVEAGPLNGDVVPARQPYVVGAHAVRAALASRNVSVYDFIMSADRTKSAAAEGGWGRSVIMPEVRREYLRLAV